MLNLHAAERVPAETCVNGGDLTILTPAIAAHRARWERRLEERAMAYMVALLQGADGATLDRLRALVDEAELQITEL